MKLDIFVSAETAAMVMNRINETDNLKDVIVQLLPMLISVELVMVPSSEKLFYFLLEIKPLFC